MIELFNAFTAGLMCMWMVDCIVTKQHDVAFIAGGLMIVNILLAYMNYVN